MKHVNIMMALMVIDVDVNMMMSGKVATISVNDDISSDRFAML
jgi:hypothetical protein